MSNKNKNHNTSCYHHYDTFLKLATVFGSHPKVNYYFLEKTEKSIKKEIGLYYNKKKGKEKSNSNGE